MPVCDICGEEGESWEMHYDVELTMWFHVTCRNDPNNWQYIAELKRIQRGGCKEVSPKWTTYQAEGGG